MSKEDVEWNGGRKHTIIRRMMARMEGQSSFVFGIRMRKQPSICDIQVVLAMHFRSEWTISIPSTQILNSSTLTCCCASRKMQINDCLVQSGTQHSDNNNMNISTFKRAACFQFFALWLLLSSPYWAKWPCSLIICIKSGNSSWNFVCARRAIVDAFRRRWTAAPRCGISLYSDWAQIWWSARGRAISRCGLVTRDSFKTRKVTQLNNFFFTSSHLLLIESTNVFV